MNGNKFSLLSLLALVRKWRKPVMLVCIVALVLSVIVAMLLPVKYKSTAVFYPASSRTIDPEWIFAGEEKIEVDLSTMDIDRIMTVAESKDLAVDIIFKYNLLNEYGLDTTNSPKSMQYALEEFYDNYNLKHTTRDAIEVSFTHTNSKMAAEIANAIVKRIDEINAGLTYENRKKVLELHAGRFGMIAEEFAIVRDSLRRTRQRYNMISEDRQSRELATRITTAEARLNEAQGQLEIYSKSLPASHPKIIELKAEINGQQEVLKNLLNASSGSAMNLENFSASVDWVAELDEQHENMLLRFNNAKSAYIDAKVALEGNVSTLYIVQKATPSPVKSSPIRWLIVAATTVGTFFCAVILITLMELYRKETQKAMA